MPRDKVLFKQTFRKGYNVLRPEAHPVLKHSNGMQPVEVNLLCAGRIERVGVVQEFQDIRLYFAAQVETPATFDKARSSTRKAKPKAGKRS